MLLFNDLLIDLRRKLFHFHVFLLKISKRVCRYAINRDNKRIFKKHSVTIDYS